MRGKRWSKANIFCGRLNHGILFDNEEIGKGENEEEGGKRQSKTTSFLPVFKP